MTREIQKNVTIVFREKWQVRTLNHDYQRLRLNFYHQ